jgi:hypothetical protein
MCHASEKASEPLLKLLHIATLSIQRRSYTRNYTGSTKLTSAVVRLQRGIAHPPTTAISHTAPSALVAQRDSRCRLLRYSSDTQQLRHA